VLDGSGLSRGDSDLRLSSLVLVVVDVAAECGGQFLIVALTGQVESGLRGGDRLGILAGFGVHGSEHLQNGRLLAVGDLRRYFELRQSVRETTGRGVDAAEVEVALGGARGEIDCLAKFGDSLVGPAHTSKDDSVDIVAVR